MKASSIMLAGALLAGSGVALGAFGAHALRDGLTEQQLGWWQTGIQYQMWHALALLALAWMPVRSRGLVAVLLGGGALLFSTSLYLMAVTDARWLGIVTPFGGATMIFGWSLLSWQLFRSGR